ncbi:hypothetical protein WA158_001522 [Blastocystis sp. Blastoise]
MPSLFWYFKKSDYEKKRVEPLDSIKSNNFIVNTDGMWNYYRTWSPINTPKAIIFFFHGVGEYIGRYEKHFQQLSAHGYLVFGMEHRGHGLSDGIRCYVRDYNALVNDQVLFIKQKVQEYPNIPVFTMGHSLGGGLCILISERVKDIIQGVIILSPCAMLFEKDLSLKPLASFLVKICPRIPLVDLDIQALSHNKTNTEAYSLDPLIYHGGVRCSTGYQLMLMTEEIQSHLDSYTYPFFITIGEEDHICNPQGVKEFYEKAGSSDKTMKLYPNMYHEMLFDEVADDLLNNIEKWIEKHL